MQAAFPEALILQGTGHLFWVGGMRLAFAEAIKSGFDYMLWLNDDTILYPNALDVMLSTAYELAEDGITAIVTGSTRDAVTGERSYGGERQVKRWFARGARSEPIQPLPDRSQPCDTMTANCTLVPQEIARKLGNFDAAFTHKFADTDYGFRARAAGFSVYVAPGYIGTCSDNPRSGTWRDCSLPLSNRWRNLMSAKGGAPFREWSLYCRRHLGPLWPLYAVSPYVKTVASSVMNPW